MFQHFWGFFLFLNTKNFTKNVQRTKRHKFVQIIYYKIFVLVELILLGFIPLLFIKKLIKFFRKYEFKK